MAIQPSFKSGFSHIFFPSNTKRVDHRTRRDRTEQRNNAFNAQMSVLTDAYMDWTIQHEDRDNPLPDPPPSINDGELSVRVINLFSEYEYFVAAFLCKGLTNMLLK